MHAVQRKCNCWPLFHAVQYGFTSQELTVAESASGVLTVELGASIAQTVTITVQGELKGRGRGGEGRGGEGTGRDGTGRDGTGRDGTGRDGTGRDGMGRDERGRLRGKWGWGELNPFTGDFLHGMNLYGFFYIRR